MTKTKTLNNNRRQFLKSITMGIAAYGLSGKKLLSSPKNKNEFIVLDENSRIDLGKRAKTMAPKAYDLGFRYEKKHRGCARCTVAALQDAIDFIPINEDLFRAASCLDGGATPDFSASCGAFTASGMMIGWVCGTGRFGDNSLSHDLIHKVHKHFVSEYGSVVCKHIRQSVDENCPKVVGNAAKWTTKILLEEFTNYEDI